MTKLIIVDKSNPTARSVRFELKGTDYMKLDVIDIKMEYFKSNKNKLDKSVLTAEELKEIDNTPDDYKFEFDSKTKYLVLGIDTFSYITKMIHLGPRSEGFYDISRMDYLVTRNGSVFSFNYINYEEKSNWLTREQYDKFSRNVAAISEKVRKPEFTSGISKKNGRPWYLFKYQSIKDLDEKQKKFIDAPIESFYHNPEMKYKIIRSEFSEAFDKLMQFGSEDHWFGLDYETSGFPFDDKDFYHMGVSIMSDHGEGFYFDMDWLQRNPDLWDAFKVKYEVFLDKYSEHVVTYNQSFEMRATYLLYHKLYFFHEAGSINKLDGLVYKNFSLKYTAMKNINVSSWDDDFDLLNDKLSTMFKKYTIDNYQESEEWKLIERTYSNDLDEFKNLFNLYYGDSFKCIPCNILGRYCCLDSYYTVLLKKIANERYKDPRAWSCFNNNLTLGALLLIHGGTIDTNELKGLEKESVELVALGYVSNALVVTDFELSLYEGFKLPELPNYLENCISNNLHPIDSKSILQKCYDANDKIGLNYELFDKYINPSIKDKVLKIIENYGNLHNGWRRRAIFEEINKVIESKLNIQSTTNSCIIGTESDLIEIQCSFKELCNLSKLSTNRKILISILKSIRENTPIYLNNKELNYDQVIEYCKTINNVASQDYHILNYAMFTMYRPYIFNLMNNYDRLSDEMLRSTEGDTNYRKYDRLLDNRYVEKWNTYLDLEAKLSPIIDKYLSNIKNNSGLRNKRLDNIGFALALHNTKYALLEKEFLEELKNPNYKESINYYKRTWSSDKYTASNPTNRCDELLNAKYYITTILGKMLEVVESVLQSGGSFKNADSNFDNKNIINYIRDNYKDYDAVPMSIAKFIIVFDLYRASKKYFKILGTYIRGQFMQYNCGTNEEDENLICTERFHKLDYSKPYKMYSPVNVCEKKSKRWSASMHTVPSNIEVKRCLTAPKGYIMSYFDISGAEVRAISYISGDEYMIDCYNRKVDPYINLAQFLTPGKDKAYYKRVRQQFKALLLGAMYGMGIATMANNAGLELEDAKKKYEIMFQKMSGIKRLAEEKGRYCREHNGLVESFLGDVLEMEKGDNDRYERLGINQFIQSIAAISLADGFCNIIKEAYKEKLHITPVNVVHDSSQNYVKIENLFELSAFYTKHLTDYLFEKYGINYLFDLEVGSNYYDMCFISNEAPDILKIGGNYTSVSKLLNRIDNESNLKYQIIESDSGIDENGKIKDFKPSDQDIPFMNFVKCGTWDAIYHPDDSWYNIKIKKVV